MSKNNAESKNQYHDIQIKDIRIVSEFRHKRISFKGVVPGFPCNLIFKLKNIGSDTFEGGEIKLVISHSTEGGSGTRSSGGGGSHTVTLSEIKPNRSKKFETKIDFPNMYDHIEIRITDVISKDSRHSKYARVHGNRLLIPKIGKTEDARSGISKKIISYASLILIIATLASTFGFGLLKP